MTILPRSISSRIRLSDSNMLGISPVSLNKFRIRPYYNLDKPFRPEIRSLFPLYLLLALRWRMGSHNLLPYAACQHQCLVLIRQGMLERKESPIIAMAVNPAAD